MEEILYRDYEWSFADEVARTSYLLQIRDGVGVLTKMQEAGNAGEHKHKWKYSLDKELTSRVNELMERGEIILGYTLAENEGTLLRS